MNLAPSVMRLARLHARQRPGILLLEKTPLSFVLPIATYGRGCIEGTLGAHSIGTHQVAVANALQESGLSGFERDQATKDVEHVHQLLGVLSEPTVGLNSLKRRRWAPIADDGPGAVAAPVAEPLDEHLLARDFVGPHLRRHVVDEAVADYAAILYIW